MNNDCSSACKLSKWLMQSNKIYFTWPYMATWCQTHTLNGHLVSNPWLSAVTSAGSRWERVGTPGKHSGRICHPWDLLLMLMPLSLSEQRKKRSRWVFRWWGLYRCCNIMHFVSAYNLFTLNKSIEEGLSLQWCKEGLSLQWCNYEDRITEHFD